MPPKNIIKNKKTKSKKSKGKNKFKRPNLTLLEDIIDHARSFYTIDPEEEIKKRVKTFTEREKRLMKYHWGFGIEHEMHLFHQPSADSKIKTLTVFDSENALYNIIQADMKHGGKLLDSVDRAYLDYVYDTGFEWSGRRCNRKDVLKRLNVRMPEFVTENPFSSLITRKYPFEYYCDQITRREAHFINILAKSNIVRRQVELYGTITQYPMGTASFIQEPIRGGPTAIKYRFKKKPNGNPETQTDYTGSYHLTITLPFTKKTKDQKFVKMHQNFANMFQWIEPLLIIGFFSCDPRAMGTRLRRVRGSFRVMRVGWGNIAGTDIRKFATSGIGRYSVIPSYWRKGLEFHNLKKLKPCDKLSKELQKKEPQAISGLSSNIRTFGSEDPLKPMDRVSGGPMNIPNGIELRIFDNFASGYLKTLCRLIAYTAENSRVFNATDYVYEDKDWIEAVHVVMKEGWRGELPEGYVRKLRKNLGLSLTPSSNRGIDVLNEVNERLFQNNKNGDWSYLFLEKNYSKAAEIPNINRQSWEMAFLMRLNREDHLLNKFNHFIYSLPQNDTLIFDQFEKLLFKKFDKSLWKHNSEDIAYLLETHHCASLTLKEGKISKIQMKRTTDWKWKDINKRILSYWGRIHHIKPETLAEQLLSHRSES